MMIFVSFLIIVNIYIVNILRRKMIDTISLSQWPDLLGHVLVHSHVALCPSTFILMSLVGNVFHDLNFFQPRCIQ